MTILPINAAQGITANLTAKAPEQPAEEATAAKLPQQDSVALSPEAKAYIAKQEKQNALIEKANAQKMTLYEMRQQVESSNQQSEAMGKEFDVKRKCMAIMSSIMHGNRVPAKDMSFLLQNDAKAYQLAMAMRRFKADPKDEKSVLGNEEDEQTEQSGSEIAPPELTPVPEIQMPESAAEAAE